MRRPRPWGSWSGEMQRDIERLRDDLDRLTAYVRDRQGLRVIDGDD